MTPQPELDSIQLTLNYMQTALRSEHPVLNSVYPQFKVAVSKLIPASRLSSDDDEDKDKNEDVDDNHNHVDILFVQRCGKRRI